MKATLAVLVLAIIGSESTQNGLFMERTKVLSQAPAPAPVPGPATLDDLMKGKTGFQLGFQDHLDMESTKLKKTTPMILGWEVEFEIENYNYYDLNKALVAHPRKDVVERQGTEATSISESKEPSPLSQPNRRGEKPGFWSKAAVGEGVEKTARDAMELPSKMNGDRRGFYPQAADNGSNTSFMVSGTQVPKNRLKGSNLNGFLQTQVHTGTGRCLTEQGMFEEPCVVDVLRDAVRSAFLDLVGTVLDTPEERDELLNWFSKRQKGIVEVGETTVQKALLSRAQHISPAPAPGPAGPGGAPAVMELALQDKLKSDLAWDAHTGVAPQQFQADVFVQFFPGRERPVAGHSEIGRSTVVKAWLRGAPNTGVFEMSPWIQAVLKRHENDGLLEMLLEKRLFDVTEVAPLISGIRDIRLDSKSQWSLDSCESHMKKIMREFSIAYTRRMVPTAIYNECTNFLAEVSFSHDRVFDSHDRIKCRHATVKLAKEWNFGQGQLPLAPAPGPAPVAAPAPGVSNKALIDFKGFCADICEIKYGNDAPMCHVTEGKMLWSAPP